MTQAHSDELPSGDTSPSYRVLATDSHFHTRYGTRPGPSFHPVQMVTTHGSGRYRRMVVVMCWAPLVQFCLGSNCHAI